LLTVAIMTAMITGTIAITGTTTTVGAIAMRPAGSKAGMTAMVTIANGGSAARRA
jgi:hypothetical protein